MAATLAEQLTSVQTAISNIESNGQSVGMSGRNLTKADLKTLYEREERLLARIARESAASRSMRTVAEF